MQYALTWWEFEELQGHWQNRSDIWTQDEENLFLWIRYEDSVEKIPTLAIQVVPPDSTSQFRMYHLMVTPLDWNPERVEAYMVHLITAWCSYGDRLEAEKILADEFKMPPELAHLASIVLGHSFIVGPITERVDLDTWQSIPRALPAGSEIASFTLENNRGILRLYTCNKGFVRALLHARSPTRYVTEFSGFLHVHGAHADQIYNRLNDITEVPDGNDSGSERLADSDDGGVQRPPEFDQGVLGLPSEVWVEQSGEPDSGEALDATGVRIGNTPVPSGTETGPSGSGSDEHRDSASVEELPETDVPRG